MTYHGQDYGCGPLDLTLHQRYFMNKKDGFFVECGASSDGGSCQFFEEEMGWHGINIEASNMSFDTLSKVRPKSRNLHYALSNKNEIRTFHDYVDNVQSHGLGSFDERICPGLMVLTYDVECVKFSDIFIENRPIDLFVLDVEGHELEALEGILEIPEEFYPKVFCIEKNNNLEKIYNLLEKYYILDFEDPINVFLILRG